MFFEKYKIVVKADDFINDTSLIGWYNYNDFKKIKDTVKVYYVAQQIIIPENLFNVPIYIPVNSVERIWQNGNLVYDFTINENKKFLNNITGIQFPFSFSKKKNIIIKQIIAQQEEEKSVIVFGTGFMSHFAFLNLLQNDHDSNITLGTLSSFLFAVSLMLLFIYLFGIQEKKYLWGTAFNLNLSLSLFLLTGFIDSLTMKFMAIIFLLLSPYFLVQFVYSLFNYHLPNWIKKVLISLSFLIVVLIILLLFGPNFFEDLLSQIDPNELSVIIPISLLFIISSVFVFVGVLQAIKNKLNNAWILFFGLILIVVLTIYWIYDFTFGENGLSGTNWYKILQILPMPLAVIITIVRDYVSANKSLKSQLIKVEELTAQTIMEQKEKQEILASQNEILEKQVTERTKEISEQKQLIEEKQKEIVDSISYAKRLQEAILPPLEFISTNLPYSFILYKPKDIVAGDFYWAEKVGDKFFLAAADSTGHGVPGAMVSVVCSNALNRTIKEFKLTETGKILDKTRDLVLETFEKSSKEVKDGMDISLLCIDKEKNKIYWSGANNPLWFIENGTLKEIKPDKQPIGKTDNPRPFTTHELDYKENLTFYLFTDGLADQFGGPKGKKFKYKQLEEILVSINDKTMQEQSVIVNQKFEFWKGELEQVDDVCIIGLRM
ncbi:MAG: PP2C family protein-serine/threonine phosphatase [Bacteroidota bacterium]